MGFIVLRKPCTRWPYAKPIVRYSLLFIFMALAIAESVRPACILNASESQNLTLDTSLLQSCQKHLESETLVTRDCWNSASPQTRILCEYFLQRKLQKMPLPLDCSDEPFLKYEDICPLPPPLDLRLPDTRYVSVQSINSVPSMHRSAQCHGCGYDGGMLEGRNARLLVIDPLGAHEHLNRSIVGVSRWSSFISAAGNSDLTTAHVLPRTPQHLYCARRITQPVIIFDILGWHIGHLIIDVFEALFDVTQRLRAEGKESLVFMGVADQHNMREYFAALLGTYIGRERNAFSLLRHFTGFTIHSKRALDMLPGITCFDDEVHIQLDVRETFSVRGPDLRNLDQRRQRYSSLRDFLLRHASPAETEAKKEEDVHRVTVVAREGSRTILNFPEVISSLLGMKNIIVQIAHLEKLSFREQLSLFAHETDVLVCQQGTAAHNAIFMPSGTSLVLFMQPGWCDWHWQFTSQALVGSQNAIAICQKPEPQPTFVVRWSKQSWLQGPWWSKNIPINVDPDLARLGVETAVNSFSILDHAVIYGEDLHIDSGELLNTCADDINMTVVGSAWALTEVRQVPGSTSWSYFVLPKIEFKWAGNGLMPSTRVQEEAIAERKFCTRLWDSQTCELLHPTRCMNSFEFNEFAHSIQVIKSSFLATVESWISGHNRRHFQLQDRRTLQFPEPYSGLPFSIGDGRLVMASEDVPYALSDTCTAHRFERCDCIKMSRSYMERYLLVRHLERYYGSKHPVPLWQPSQDLPFVFLHLEKTAGTCLRDILADAGRQSPDLKSFLPCHGGVDCMTFNLRQASASENLFGGHFAYGAWEELGFPRAYVSTIQRHPVARAISYYYERVYPQNGIKLNDLPARDLRTVLNFWRGSAYSLWRDEGLSDAGCKMVCGVKTHSGQSPLMAPLKSAAETMGRCTVDLAVKRLNDEFLVGIQERWEETVDVFGYFLPWLETSITKGCAASTHGSNRRSVIFETIETISDEARALIEEYNQCDMALYAAAQEKFSRQLESIERITRQRTFD